MEDLEQGWVQSCRQHPLRIGFPEGGDVRVQSAAKFLLESGEASEVWLWNGKGAGRFVDSSNAEVTNRVLQHLKAKYEEKKGEVWCLEAAQSPLVQAGVFLETGELDAVVSGSIATTGDVIRAGLKAPGLQKGTKVLSSAFLMHRKDVGTFVFADCGVIVAPNVEQHVEIAENALQLYQEMGFENPKVAFLSFSTFGSAEHEQLISIRKATQLFQQQNCNIPVVGEVQVDAALVPSVAQQKAPGAAVLGDANILIFPDLNSGNIAYKFMQRFGGFQAWGPILLGLKKPYADLSRGASVEDIVASARIALIRARSL